MFSLGQIDIEAAAAYELPLSFQQPFQSGNLFLAAYYDISPQIEMSLESFSWISDLGAISHFTLASANVKYTFPNAPFSLKVGLQNSYTTWRAPLTSIKFGVSYDFGTPSGFRPFGKRGFDFFPLVVAVRS